MFVILNTHRLDAIKPSFATRRIPAGDIAAIDMAATDLMPGDVVLARVDEIGQHKRIERPDGRRAILIEGDEILIVCGARYAPDQFEAACPTSLGPADLVAAGGIAGIELVRHERMDPATKITLLGTVLNAHGKRLNLADYAVAAAQPAGNVPVIAVVGTSMNAGKTHTVASIVQGLAQMGTRVAALKVTGTGAGGDLWLQKDVGASVVMDFTDAGFGTTYRVPVDEIETGADRLMAAAEAQGAEVIVVEVADGLRQQETAALMQSPRFSARLHGVVFAAGDAMGAEAGVAWLQKAGHDVRAISGLLTRSPLAIREAEAAGSTPVLTPEQLRDPQNLEWLTGAAVPSLSIAA